ncbi:hypothetical protein GCM10023169_36120 [Georgenia halophila]|uniref:Orc1-like AAA ATPase domain-containing protein n=1 Tax=Georgenia halophila TaxID=620889 RepID=A0ABP8LN93_9MICO
MASIGIEFTAGARYTLDLQGQRSAYTLTGRLREISDTSIRFDTDEGRSLTIPLRAVTFARALDGPRGITEADPSQRDLGRAIKRSREEAAKDEDPIQGVKLVRETMREIAPRVTSAANRARIESAIELSNLVERHVLSRDLRRASRIRQQILSVVKSARVGRGPRYKPTSLAAEIDAALGWLYGVETEHWDTFAALHYAPPRIITRDRINVSRDSANEFELPIRVTLDSSAAEVHDVRVRLDKFRNLKIIGAAPKIDVLKPGDSAILRTQMRDNRKQGARADIRIDAHLAFEDLAGRRRESPRQTLDLRIVSREIREEIPNPFRAYAGGLPIESEEMFFGRRDLVAEFVKELSKASGGMCYALYGQQRTGKSSVLAQVRSRLRERGAIVAALSIGTIDRKSMTIDFIEEVLDQFRVQVHGRLPKELSSTLLSRWPDSAAIEKRPLRSFQRARAAAAAILRSAGHTAIPFVVVVDEFTYLHEILRRRGIEPSEHNELRDFMRQLKGLLEGRLFSALLVGQDTMPRFLDAYPNEFSVMATRKLDYLRHDETQALADEPVRTRDGQSRYSGYALSTIATYTDGHPFFTQIVCDRVISTVNSKSRVEITQSDVEEAVESLIAGQDCIEFHKFDCLVTADNTHALLVDMTGEGGEKEVDGSRDALAVLRRIAAVSGSLNEAVPIERLQLDSRHELALDDLLMRGVVRKSDAGVVIRVLLYADYLRRQ